MARPPGRQVSALDPKEQRYAYVAAGMGAAASVALWAPAFDERAGIALGAIGVAMAALLAAAARRRSRLLTGVASVLLAFGPWGMAWLIGLPYLVLASWLALRAPKIRAEPPPRAEGGEDGDAGARPGPRTPRTTRWRRRAPKDGGTEEAPGPSPPRPAPPPASKRYTPPQRRP